MRNFLSMTGVAIVGVALIFSSCVDSSYTPPDYEALLETDLEGVDQTQLAADLAVIDDSVFNKWDLIDTEIDPRGKVRYRVLSYGAGQKPVLTSYILMTYTAILFDSLSYSPSTGFTGEPFDQNLAPTVYYPLYNLIPAFRTVLPLLPAGTRVQMFIPSGLAYGPYAVPNQSTGEVIVPEDSNLFFDLTIQDVQNQ